MQLWTMAGASAALAAFSSFADWKRQRRSDPDRVGFMPWTSLSLIGVVATMIFIALALKTPA
ncbi:MAG: hypothetical protein J0626_12475 [Rhodospirillaceae bacterium]|nr:hypothetical protein [Rhodospirillaceae bacterium]